MALLESLEPVAALLLLLLIVYLALPAAARHARCVEETGRPLELGPVVADLLLLVEREALLLALGLGPGQHALQQGGRTSLKPLPWGMLASLNHFMSVISCPESREARVHGRAHNEEETELTAHVRLQRGQVPLLIAQLAVPEHLRRVEPSSSTVSRTAQSSALSPRLTRADMSSSPAQTTPATRTST